MSASIPKYKQVQFEDQDLGAKNKLVRSVGSRSTKLIKLIKLNVPTGI
jgi:hypothetical protein